MITYIIISIVFIFIAYIVGYLFGYAKAKYDERKKRGTS
jgi:hypothetical protein